MSQVLANLSLGAHSKNSRYVLCDLRRLPEPGTNASRVRLWIAMRSLLRRIWPKQRRGSNEVGGKNVVKLVTFLPRSEMKKTA